MRFQGPPQLLQALTAAGPQFVPEPEVPHRKIRPSVKRRKVPLVLTHAW